VTSPDAKMEHDGELLAQEVARADIYAIIGRFFYDAPDESLLAAIKEGGEDGEESGPFGAAWRALREACATADPAILQQEFNNLFQGAGKSEITPFSSRYVKKAAPDRHLVRLRHVLASWNLGRSGATTETEDHVAGLCDVMRFLIRESRPIDEQTLFFNEFIYPGIVPFCEAIGRSVNASFYRCVAQFTLAFLAVEKAAFDMQDT
jgi:TorA maturation chaperone TorD